MFLLCFTMNTTSGYFLQGIGWAFIVFITFVCLVNMVAIFVMTLNHLKLQWTRQQNLTAYRNREKFASSDKKIVGSKLSIQLENAIPAVNNKLDDSSDSEDRRKKFLSVGAQAYEKELDKVKQDQGQQMSDMESVPEIPLSPVVNDLKAYGSDAGFDDNEEKKVPNEKGPKDLDFEGL